MNEDLNLVEVLKDCPKGTLLYSTIYGEVNFDRIIDNPDYPISFTATTKSECKEGGEITITTDSVTKNGLHTINANGECTLFPSKTQRDWSKFKVKKPKFDPKTLQPFDKVLIRTFERGMWCASFISVSADKLRGIPDIIGDYDFDIVIPYNEDTKHLAGTSDEAPEYYRYWED